MAEQLFLFFVNIFQYRKSNRRLENIKHIHVMWREEYGKDDER